ncbi:MAG: hypothetical protein JWM28_1744, partial [Chitinophagaceae bacterium]|nr:hypothetical protein [Chitinophagaceae bacterium]
MKSVSRIFLLTTLCFIAGFACAQIVNMESQRYHTDTTGWKGSISGDFALTNYGQKVVAVNGNAHLQYQSVKSLYLLLGSYGFLKGGGQSFIDYDFLHFRYNYKLNRIIRLEAFAQLQQNAIIKIQSRFLVGAGPRFKIVSNKKLKLYGGILAAYEIQKETGVPQERRDWRSSDYLSLTFSPDERTEFITTTYYQPVFNNISDYRLLSQTMFKIKAGKKISVNLNWTYQFDARPAGGS